MNNLLVISLFLVVKIFQWLNSIVLTNLFNSDKGYYTLISIFFLIIAIFLFSLLFKKFLPKYISFGWIFIIIIMFIFSYLESSSPILSLLGIFLYAFISAESKVLQSFSKYKNIPRILLFLISLIPIVISYWYPSLRITESNILYMVSSVFAFLASYSAQKYGDGESIIYRDAPSVWLGISFIIVSSLIYYIGYSRIIGDYNIIYLILLFYVGGGLIVYMNIDKRLQKIE